MPCAVVPVVAVTVNVLRSWARTVKIVRWTAAARRASCAAMPSAPVWAVAAMVIVLRTRVRTAKPVRSTAAVLPMPVVSVANVAMRGIALVGVARKAC